MANSQVVRTQRRQLLRRSFENLEPTRVVSSGAPERQKSRKFEDETDFGQTEAHSTSSCRKKRTTEQEQCNLGSRDAGQKSGVATVGDTCSRDSLNIEIASLEPALSGIIQLQLSLPTTMNPVRIFIASLGNPPPYASTRHSAGHILIKALQSHLQFPTFRKSKIYASGATAMGEDVGRSDFTLWQSPSLMNVSGVALLKAYKTFTQSTQSSPTDPLPGLVILYDEMETSPAQLRVRRGVSSAKGHNGLKSVQQSLQSAGLMDKLGDKFVKIGVGIGRPQGGSRSSEDVSQYVLGQLTGKELQGIEAKATELATLLDAELLRMSN